ncbi:DUF4253 domain-containing protein [Blastococcus sp. URHD0036]|uniref:DUF4253 domain-containing protein n=1 Tax=Blastococcus sp. URHD0036 TaxID=1380356 RepID=UPI00068EE2C8|nr:DUF4253 domain-containing protein [Blastococcus sp. URHD0036]
MTRSSSSWIFEPSFGAHIDVPVLGPVRPTSASLPAAGPLRLGDVSLGSGRPVGGTPAPALWLTDDRVPDTAEVWRRLVDLFPETGLWPLLATPFERSRETDPVPPADVDAVDPAVFLADQWAGWLVPIGEHPYVEHLTPYGAHFPGLAPPLVRDGDPASATSGLLGDWGLRRLGLVRCDRPADAVAALGWTGAGNYCGTAEVAAVLRSWEDRFGVVLTGLLGGSMDLLLPHPPASVSEALPVAAEVAAFCRDTLRVDGPGEAFGYRSGGTVEGLARCLVGEPVWTLWWD